jgi:hypothetical protein
VPALKARGKTRTAAPGSLPSETEGASLVAWHGLSLRVPEGWSPVAVNGDGATGYVKVVSPDTRYLELKWEQPRGAVNVVRSLEAYFDRLRRAAKKSRREITLRQRPRGLTGVRPQKQSPIPYAWEADRKALGCIWHCGECNRLVIAELVGEPDDDLSIAGDLLKGVRDHGDEEGWTTWGLYGLAVTAPASYRMEKQSLVTGHQRFQLRDRGASLQADRWGLAAITLRGSTLRQWYEAREIATLTRYAYKIEELELHGHPALRITGRDRLPYALLKVLRAPMGLTWPRFFFHAYVWQCPESNRVYALSGEQPRRGTLVAEIAARLKCH